MKKQHALSVETQKRIKLLSKEDFQIYQKIEHYVFQHYANPIKANIVLEKALELIEQHQIIVKKNMKETVSFIEKKESMKDLYQKKKEEAITKYTISGLWQTMSSYIVLLFVKELMTNHYLIHFSIDLLIAVIAFYITFYQLKGQYHLITSFQLSYKAFVVVLISFAMSFIIAILTAHQPFDITFLILVIGFITGKKIFEKELK